MHPHFRNLLLALLLPCTAVEGNAQGDRAADIRYVAPVAARSDTARVRDSAHVAVVGPITAESPQLLLEALKVARTKPDAFTLGGQPIIKVFLNSPGGSVAAGIAMGRLLRQFAAEVWIDQDEICASACILVLAGGVSRWAVPTARLLVHRPVFEQSLFAGLTYDDAQRKYTVLANSVRDYLRDMGVSDELYHTMMRIPSSEISQLDNRTARQLALLGKDPAHEEWDRARAINRQGEEMIQTLDRYVKCINSGRSDRDCLSQPPRSSPNSK
jgi:hypothetical protein